MDASVSDPAHSADFVHLSVLSEAIQQGLALRPSGYYLDATAGGGGHSYQLLCTDPTIHLTLIDRDAQAITAAQRRLSAFPANHLSFWQGNFADFPGQDQFFDGIIADLGVSSPQLDQAERGFSFRQMAPLDMRMDQSQTLTAAEIINHWSEADLVRIFFEYGEERLSRRIARQIAQQRPFTTTTELAETIARSVPGQYRYGRIHPATRVFQALRIVVNDELGSLERFLALAPQWLKPAGRLGIISFHSLEDRLVKHRFRESPLLKVLTKKPVMSDEAEQARNPRSRSAKLRWAERIILDGATCR
ncbi:16S rRNA (cytosine(1402)-N(4))-methyltransferase RsmH [Synechocystis sp. LKSZ1]|uniref:16S rRNA (cytosine(1402)-N(4))-methyltransferase RsmH n=1 Tax=Synechocystis sp. LKSZ1 TaxID=3144951 RepID=UPI00336BEDFF